MKIFLINLVKILMMSAKMVTPGFLKIIVFWNKGYDIMIPVDDITNKILSHDSNYIVDLFMWPSVVTLAFLWEKLSQPQFYQSPRLFNRSFLGDQNYYFYWFLAFMSITLQKPILLLKIVYSSVPVLFILMLLYFQGFFVLFNYCS